MKSQTLLYANLPLFQFLRRRLQVFGLVTLVVDLLVVNAASGVGRAAVRGSSNQADEGASEIRLMSTDVSPEISITHSCGTVVVWGNRFNGVTNVPLGLQGVRAIAAGYEHTVALRNDGTIVAWGDNTYGQASSPPPSTFPPPPVAERFEALAAGGYHNLALRTDSTVVGWGQNSKSQSSVPAALMDVQALAAGQWHSVALKRDGTVVCWGGNESGQLNVPKGLTEVRAIAAGSYHTVAVRSNGTVVAWGNNVSGQTNVPVGLTEVQSVAASQNYTVALRFDGTLAYWGNPFGNEVPPAGLASVQAVAVSTGGHALALLNNGTVAAWGGNVNGQTRVPVGLTGVTAIAAGGAHSGALVESTAFFGDQSISRPGVAKTFTIINSGLGPLAIEDISVAGGDAADFKINTNGMPAELPPGGRGTFTIAFHPSAVGARNTSLRVFNNDADESTYQIALTGTGTGPERWEIDPTSVTTFNGIFRFALANPNNTTLDVFATTNLNAPSVQWNLLGTTTRLGNGFDQFLDSDAANHPIRFYQLRVR